MEKELTVYPIKEELLIVPEKETEVEYVVRKENNTSDKNRQVPIE